MKKEDLEHSIRVANEHYSRGLPTMTDSDYDALWLKLREIDPTNSLLWLTHRPEGHTTIVRHPKIWLSLDKAMDPKRLNHFLTRYQNEVLAVQPKYDGCTVLEYPREDGLYTYALSGNGVEGADITHHIGRGVNFLASPSNAIYKSYEAIITNEDWNPSYGANPRNVVSGWLNRKDPLAYELQRAITLVEHNNTLYTTHINAWEYDHATLWEACLGYFTTWARTFPLDGIVLKVIDEHTQARDGHNGQFPAWAIAWKPPIQTAETTVTDIEWNTSRTGRVVPTVLYSPVQLAGTSNTKATGNNAAWLEDLGISIGCRIVVGKAGEIIPTILSCERLPDVRVELPRQCPSCSASLKRSGRDLVCHAEGCIVQALKRIKYFYSLYGMNIRNIAEKRFAILLENGALEYLGRSPWRLLILDQYPHLRELVLMLWGAEKLEWWTDAVARASGTRNYAHLLASLGFAGLAYKNALKILQSIREDITCEAGPKALESWENHASTFLRAVEELTSAGYKIRNIPSSSCVYFTITGDLVVPRETAISLAEEKLGWVFSPSVTKAVTHVVHGSIGHESIKLRMANERGLIIVTKDDFESFIGVGNE